MIIVPRGELRTSLNRAGRWYLPAFLVSEDAVEEEYSHAKSHHQDAGYDVLIHAEFRAILKRYPAFRFRWLLPIAVGLGFALAGHCQSNPNVNIDRVGGTKVTTTIPVTCISGCGSGSLPTGASTEAKQDDEITGLADILAELALIKAKTDNLDVAFSSLAFYQVTQPVSIAGTVAVSGPLTDTQLRATAVPVDGSGVTQPVSGTVTANISGSISNTSFTVTQATGSNLHVQCDSGCAAGTGDVNVHDGAGNAITSTSSALDVNVKNASIPVTGTFYQATQPISAVIRNSSPVTASWTSATALDSTTSTLDTSTYESVQIALTPSGSFSGGVVTFEISADGVNWAGVQCGNSNASSGSSLGTTRSLSTLTVPAILTCPSHSATNARVRLSTVITGGGTVSVSVMGSSVRDATYTMFATLAGGTSSIGSISNSSFIATQSTASSLNATVVGSGNFASTVADGANVVLGAKADAKSTATDTTAVTMMSVLKEISAMEQAPASRVVTVASGGIASGGIASGAIASGAVASGAFASGSISDGADVTLGAKADAKSTATDTTAVSAMSVLKQISASVQAPPSQAVTNAGTFAVQSTAQASSAVMGKVGFDQTTPGTTNAVEPVPDTSSSVALSASGKASVTTSVNVKSSAGNVYGFSVTNGAASICWIQFVNNSGNGTLGTLPIFSAAVPASGTLNYPPGSFPLANFSSGIAVGMSTAVNGASACGTAGNITVFYK